MVQNVSNQDKDQRPGKFGIAQYYRNSGDREKSPHENIESCFMLG
jgi:hypothetical protein